MRVLVTGGSGRIGTATVADLVAHGYSVVSADRRRGPSPLPDGARFVEIDLGDVGQVAGAMEGCEAVIHLGAIPSPYSFPDEVVFNNNVRGTFAVFQAARLLGVKKVAFASSLSALGTAWAPEPFPPLYAPVDETHPLLNHDCYGLSKEVDERTAEMFHRLTGMQVAALRFCWVSHMDEAKEAVERIKADPGHPQEWRVLWAYVDVRDAAASCRRAIEADGFGFAAFNITADDTLSDIPTEELLRTYTPSLEIRRSIPGTASAFSNQRAKDVLGWTPEHSWRTE